MEVVFPSQKYRMIRERLLSEGFAEPADFTQLGPAYEREPVSSLSAAMRTAEGILIAPAIDLARMKLTSFRLKDQVQIA